MTNTPLDHAKKLTAQGYSVIPVPDRSKAPKKPGWQKFRLSLDDLAHHFGTNPSNIGVLWGSPSGGIVDVDLDHPLARELADKYLPKTGAEWGRASSPRSHRLYRVTGPCPYKNWKLSKAADAERPTIVELRSDGHQSIAPGSIHPCGEDVRWDSDGEPFQTTEEEIKRCLSALAAAVDGEREPEQSIVATEFSPPDSEQKLGFEGVQMSPDEVVYQCAITGAGQHDRKTLELARGLKLNARLNCSEAELYFDKWWASGRVYCNEKDPDAALFKFQHAYDAATKPLNTPGPAAWALSRLDSLSPSQFEAGLQGRGALLVRVLVEIYRLVGDAPFAISAHQVGEALGCSDQSADLLVKGLIRRGLIECVSKGRPGVNGRGKARRLRWIAGPTPGANTCQVAR